MTPSKITKLIVGLLLVLSMFAPFATQAEADEVTNYSFTADHYYWDQSDSIRIFELIVHYRVYYASAGDCTINITVNMCEEDGIFVDDWLTSQSRTFEYSNDSSGVKDLYIGENGVFDSSPQLNTSIQPFTWTANLALNDEAAGFPGNDDQEFRTYIHIDNNGSEVTHDDETIELVIGYKTQLERIEDVPNYRSYCQMLCMALGGVPIFFYSIDKFNPFDYRCQPF